MFVSDNGIFHDFFPRDLHGNRIRKKRERNNIILKSVENEKKKAYAILFIFYIANFAADISSEKCPGAKSGALFSSLYYSAAISHAEKLNGTKGEGQTDRGERDTRGDLNVVRA